MSAVTAESDRPAQGSVAKMVDRLSKVDIGTKPGQHAATSGSSTDPQIAVRKPAQKAIGKAVVRFSYTPAHDDELPLQVDETVEVLANVEEGWMEGRVNGRKGVFPSNFVDFQPLEAPGGLSSPRPSKEECDTTTQAVKATEEEENPPEATQRAPKKVQGVGFGSLVGGRPVKLRSTKPDTAETTINFAQNSKTTNGAVNEKVPAPASHNNSVGSVHEDIIVPNNNSDHATSKQQWARVLYTYTAAHEDELSLTEVGSLVAVRSTKCEDPGWFMGEINGKQGVFPDNFVELLSEREAAREIAKRKAQSPPTIPIKPVKPLSPSGKPGGSGRSSTPPESGSQKHETKELKSGGSLKTPLNSSQTSNKTEATFIEKSESRTAPPEFGPDAFKKKREMISGGFKFGLPAPGSQPPPFARAPQRPPPEESASAAGDTVGPPDLPEHHTNHVLTKSAAGVVTRLDHPTVNRPKQMHKRPPSRVFLDSKQRMSSGDELDRSVDSDTGSPVIANAKAIPTSSSGDAATTQSAALLPPPQPRQPSPVPPAAKSAQDSGGSTVASGATVTRAEYDALLAEFKKFKSESNAKVADLESKLSRLGNKI